jgi:hypothetical protein
MGVIARCDKRARLPDALESLLRVPVLTPKALAARLKLAPRPATTFLRALQGRGGCERGDGTGQFSRVHDLTLRCRQRRTW